MSKKVMVSGSVQHVEHQLLSTNERILKDIHDFYVSSDLSISMIAQTLHSDVVVPRRKITVLLLGNHSAGKSTFINWYIQETVQKTGVAIETQGFTVITNGKKRESLKGSATLKVYPYLKDLHDITGVMEYLSTEISSSVHRKFPMLTFIDTPGLVDGDMVYPFDVNQALVKLGQHADIIFVFFDPIGQALCKRTLNIVEQLSEKYADKLRFYLSKADEAGGEADRQKVLMQIVQEICRRPILNRAGFDMPTIYIPDDSISRNGRCLNQIEEPLKQIERCIDQNIQSVLETLESDCDRLSMIIDEALSCDQCVGDRRSRAWSRIRWLVVLTILLPVLCAVTTALPKATIRMLFGDNAVYVDFFQQYWQTPIYSKWQLLSADVRWYLPFVLVLYCTFFIIISQTVLRRLRSALSKQQRMMYHKFAERLKVFKTRKNELYEEYFRQAVCEDG